MKQTNKHLLFFALTVAFFGNCMGKKGNKTAVTNCGSESVGCYSLVNAMGDPVIIDVEALTIEDLKIIDKDRKVDIVLPVKVGSSTAYRFTPSAGESKGVKTLVVFENVKQRPGTRLAGKAVIIIARHFEPVEKGKPWIEVGRIEIDGKEVEQEIVPVTFKPDGSVVWINFKGDPEVFPVTKKDLGQAKS